MQGKPIVTMSEKFREDEREKEKQKSKKAQEQAVMEGLAARLADAQQAIAQRKMKDGKRLMHEELEGRRKFIDVDEEETQMEDYRQNKRSKIEEESRQIKEKNMAEVVRKRQRWEDKKTRDCGEWKQARCQRGDQCRFKHDPKDHPQFSAYVDKHGAPPPSIVHFLNFEGVL
ncbi:hypothetical protein DIPPA_29499 [Diplonema papillatum]|nr:hypothetical protein DIPPA_29499 [Diplonema papillatum]